MEKQVFISYKTEDFVHADWVRTALEKNGISCWMAPMCIPGGSSYAAEIPKAITQCDFFVLILSEHAQQSKWVSRELDRAINENKTVLPFAVEACKLTPEFKFYLTNVQCYYAHKNQTAAIKELINDICNATKSTNSAKKVYLPPKKRKHQGFVPVAVLAAIAIVTLLFGGLFIREKTADSAGKHTLFNNPTIDSLAGDEISAVPTEVDSSRHPPQNEATQSEITETNLVQNQAENTQPPTMPEGTKPATDAGVSNVVYEYRAACPGDDHTGLSINVDNDIVITGIKTYASDGIYHIPSYIDGKRVISIDGYAFNSYISVKEVYLGETVRNVGRYTFSSCYDLEKIYIACDKIYFPAFNQAHLFSLTIYSSAECQHIHDVYDDCYLKDNPNRICRGAQWQEWNG